MMITAPNQQLLSEVEAFIERHGISASRFGTLAMNNPSFVLRLRQGANVTSESVVRARTWMAEYAPPKPRRARGNDRVAA